MTSFWIVPMEYTASRLAESGKGDGVFHSVQYAQKS